MGEVKLSNLDEAKAIQTAQEIVRLEAVLSKMKDDLKSYVEQNGELVAAGKIWSFNESVSLKLTSLQKQEVAKQLAIEGINFWDVIKLSATDLQKQGWDESKMQPFGTISYRKTFSSKNEK